MPALTSIALGVGAAGAIGGAVQGARGSSQTSATNVPEAGAQERDLQQQAIRQYLQQRQLIDQQQGGISALDPYRQASLQGLQGIASGQAFQSTPEELANINALREAQIRLGTQDVNRMLEQNMQRTTASAGIRGLRGQALSELQGNNLRLAGEQTGNIVNQAGAFAAQQAVDNPYRRVAAQSPALQTGLTYQDQLRQQAIQNRQLASNPGLLDYYQRQRIAGATTTQSTPGGGFWGGLSGAMGGFGGGFNTAAQGIGAYNQLSQMGTGGGGSLPGAGAWAGGSGNRFSDIA